AHIVHSLRIGLLARLGEPVADSEASIAARGKVGAPMRKSLARAAAPIAAVDVDEEGKRSLPCRQIEIADQLDAVMVGVGDVLADVAVLPADVGHETSVAILARGLAQPRVISLATANFP